MKNPMLRDLGCWCVDSCALCYSRNLWVLLSYLLCIDIVLLPSFQIVIVNSLQGSISPKFSIFEVDAGIRPDGTERAKCNFNARLGCKAFELTLGLGPMARNVLSATSLHTALQS